ncbi:HDL548Wp [Eremothecium sinecaudum]|uniref:HDL548Wp n=1 Tax=Eremothecium sinecaudum TaxID=45286 RepID=A0A0X8HRP6_9SACH|nr:HDL548Wp [Eremothecium sinecaudum]AMD20196.1 HDL548Wp [Eremothecium sinecaudum]
MLLRLLISIFVLSFGLVNAETHTLRYTTGWVTRTPDGVTTKQVIAFNGEWPLPDIHVRKGDRVELYLTNGFTDRPTSLHFHGLFHNTSQGNNPQNDGPQMVTQCPIQPGDTYLYNFTVPDQVGTYWYHSHSGAQYADGMRGAFIIHDDQPPFEYDEEMTIMVSDIYKSSYTELTKKFMSRYNPTGAEPIPQNLLFNHTTNATINFEPNKRYMLRIINGAFFVSQYLYIEDHSFTVVEVDGVYVKPYVTDLLYLGSGQRVSVLVQAKNTTDRNYAFMQTFDTDMLDVIPSTLQLNRTNQLTYDSRNPPASPYQIDSYEGALQEFNLTTQSEERVYDEFDYQVSLDFRMDNLGDGVNYALFNNFTYVQQKVPTLTTVLTSEKNCTNPIIYGNINPIILGYDEVVEIVINNYDTGSHPFHLHGHNFQIVQKSPKYTDRPVPYNASEPLSPIPEYPAVRDTAILEGYGHIVLRYKANNPGVWIFHCHVGWHLEQGLAAVFIEAPELLQSRVSLTDNYKEICSSGNIPISGNAAGHSDSWFNLKDAPKQPPPLPTGFTAKGYIAIIVTSLVGIFGLYTITNFGLQGNTMSDEEVYETLSKVLTEKNIEF